MNSIKTWRMQYKTPVHYERNIFHWKYIQNIIQMNTPIQLSFEFTLTKAALTQTNAFLSAPNSCIFIKRRR